MHLPLGESSCFACHASSWTGPLGSLSREFRDFPGDAFCEPMPGTACGRYPSLAASANAKPGPCPAPPPKEVENRETWDSISHSVVLDGSIADNARYVPGKPPVISQLKSILPHDWEARSVAADGSLTSEVTVHLPHLPASATHLVFSTGTNEAVQSEDILTCPVACVPKGLEAPMIVRERFERNCRRSGSALLELKLPPPMCTVYDLCSPEPLELLLLKTALSHFLDKSHTSTLSTLPAACPYLIRGCPQVGLSRAGVGSTSSKPWPTRRQPCRPQPRSHRFPSSENRHHEGAGAVPSHPGEGPAWTPNRQNPGISAGFQGKTRAARVRLNCLREGTYRE